MRRPRYRSVGPTGKGLPGTSPTHLDVVATAWLAVQRILYYLNGGGDDDDICAVGQTAPARWYFDIRYAEGGRERGGASSRFCVFSNI